MNEPKQLLDRVLEVLRARGAEGDAWLEERSRVDTSLRDGKVESISRAESRGLAVRAMSEGRLGFCHTARVDLAGVAEAAAKACDLARAGSPRDDLALAPPAGPGDGSDEGAALQRFDPTVPEITPEHRADWLRRAEATARAHDPRVVRTEAAWWGDGSGSVWIANTNGLYRHRRGTGINAGIGVIAEEKGEMQGGSRDWEGTTLAAVPGPEALGREAAERAVRMLGAAPVETGRYPIVFSPDAGWALLVYLGVALNGDHLSRGRSWLAPRLQETPEAAIGSPLLTVRDAARHPDAPASTPFDGEGVDTRDLTLIEAGRVQAALCDLASARRMGRASTGSSNRNGYESLPAVGSFNVHLVPGSRTPEEILASVERGLWVFGLSGWWIGLDPSNDRFSSAASGLWIENGKPVRPVARVTIAGPLLEICAGIDMVGNDLVWDHPTKAPTYRVKEMAVSGT